MAEAIVVFHAALRVLIMLLSVNDASLPLPQQTGIASVFGYPGDNSGPLACKPHRGVLPGEHVCAHRTLPCGTKLILENDRTEQRSWCVVWEHGPYGATLEDDTGKKVWVVKAKASDPGHWRGILDLSQAVSDDLGHNRFEQVKMWTIKGIFRATKERVKRRMKAPKIS